MRRSVLVATFALALVAAAFGGAALAGPDVLYVCVKSGSGSMRAVTDPASCTTKETSVDLAIAGTETGTTFTLRENTQPVQAGGTYTPVTYRSDCVAGETAISGGLYWADPQRRISADQMPGDGRIVNNGWEVLMPDVDAGAAAAEGIVTIFVMCAA